MHKNAFVCGCTACTAQIAWKTQEIQSDLTALEARLQGVISADPTISDEDFDTVTPGVTYYGTLTPAGDSDILTVTLTAGETYLVSLRGTGDDAVTDTLLVLYDAEGNLVNYDDDGGTDINSLLTFTAAESGTYYIGAESFGEEAGDYRVDVIAESSIADVGDTFATAQMIAGGLTFGFIDDAPGVVYLGLGEVDTFKIELVAGRYYTFQLAGGADYETDFLDVPPGELDTVLFLYDEDGNRVAFNDDLAFPSNISSGLAFLASESGTYYLDVAAYEGQTGGYTLQVGELDVSGLDPLDSIRWENADNIEVSEGNIAYVYFANEGENFGELADDNVSPLASFGWNNFEKDQLMLALEQYSKITGITYMETDDASEATFRLITTESSQYGAYMYPNDPAFGDAVGIGAFNVLSGGWNLPGQQSLLRGGFAFGVILHEFGHAHGLAHPHDTGGGSDVMLGVTGADSLGFYNLNQGVYTVMSYNDAWETHPDGPSPYTRETVGQGFSGSLSAFDIAALQERYGVHDYATGNDRYELKDINGIGTYYETIWDTGGTDEIRYNGSKAAQIDLLAATLDYSPTGGGVVSFVDGIWGGFTIANGVVIENATGGSGDDVLMGNDANNVLNGRAGSDHVDGRGGDDRIFYDDADRAILGGQGRDTLVVSAAVTVDLGKFTTTQIAGKNVYGFEDLDAAGATGAVVVTGSQWNNTVTGSAFADTILAGGGSDVVNGGGGADTLDGGAGRDVVHGEGGADVITYDATDYAITGGDGDDTLVVSSTITIDLGRFTTTQVTGQLVYGFEHVDARTATGRVTVTGSQWGNTVTGGAFADTISAGGGSDVVNGGGGADTLDGGAGRDVVHGEGGADVITYDATDYAITGGDGDDMLVVSTAIIIDLGRFTTTQVTGRLVYGFEHVDAHTATDAVTVTGSQWSNTIIGGSGADTINGGGGYDTLTGGAGADRFVFGSAAVAAGGRATITDFAGDIIDLSGIDAVEGGGDDAFTFIGAAQFHGVAGELRVVNASGGRLIQGDLDGNGVLDFSILVNAGAALQATDFVL